MTEEYNPIKESGYDQKAFLQIRLHELLSTIDRLNLESARFPIRDQTQFQKAIFKNLTGVFSTISSKLTSEEKTRGIEERKKILELFEKHPISFIRNTIYGKNGNFYSQNNLNLIVEGLFDYRILLEEFMDAHGFNPSKESATKAIAKQ